MTSISKEVNELCVLLGIKVLNKIMSKTDAEVEAVAFGSNRTSANDTFTVVRCMAEGKRYLRGLSAEATEFALNALRDQMGDIYFENALNALEAHIVYDEVRLTTKRKKLRSVHEKFVVLRGPRPDMPSFYAQEYAALAIALTRNPTDRAARLAAADPMPRTTTVTATVYLRNPDVVAEVLLRAGDNCEVCARPAPFMRQSNGLPYLEVHHKHRLADGGHDTVENAIALCPNCHREAHFGVNSSAFRK